MQYLSELYDSFYVQREFNRDLDYIRELLEWTRANNKGLYMLANSGCLVHCSPQTFHDNLVAHEQEICETVNVENWTPYACWNYYKDKANWRLFYRNLGAAGRPDNTTCCFRLSSWRRACTPPRDGHRGLCSPQAQLQPARRVRTGFGPAFAPWSSTTRNSGLLVRCH
jgi:hypothetical protein